ncbi:MAG: GatB/YqeY domain-containing protein, partial [Calditrichaeota bacterium]
MSIQEKLTEDLKAAMKAKDALRVETIRMLRAQMKDRQIAKGEELTEEDEIAVLTNAAKKRREAIELYKQSDRTDLLQKEEQELAILSAYLPEQMGREEIEAQVEKIIAEVGASSVKDLGKVMSVAMKSLKG